MDGWCAATIWWANTIEQAGAVEFGLIRTHFTWQDAPPDVVLGVGDDAAVLQWQAGRELVVAADTSNAGIHFPIDAPAHAVGYKSLAVNLSDLAAMGAQPLWFTLALSLPQADPLWVEEFAQGLRAAAQQYGIFLVGGDTTRGALSATIQVMGWVGKGQALRRAGAQPGDLVCVSGTLGDAAAGLAAWQRRLVLPPTAADFCIHRLHYPTPRLALGQALCGKATACMDLSDGLLGDLRHILAASNVGASIFHRQLPLSDVLMALPLEQKMDFALRGGDDYELLFTLPPRYLSAVQLTAAKLNAPVTVIGEITALQQNLMVDYAFPDGHYGYEHFS